MKDLKETPRKPPQAELLARALLALRSPQECYSLLEDLCTIQEIQALTQRIEVARLLRKRITYQEIAGMTGASTATISRVNKCLTYGANGYNTVLDRMEGKEWT